MDAGVVFWFTGLPAAGKSTLARAVAASLRARGERVEILDGDEVRTHLSAGLTFSRHDRETNVARIAFVAQLLSRNGVHVAVAAVSPFVAGRRKAREMIPKFVEIHVSTPLDECIRRDPKGLYESALAGRLKAFTGVSDPYEEPEQPELRIDTQRTPLEDSVNCILARMATSNAVVDDARMSARARARRDDDRRPGDAPPK